MKATAVNKVKETREAQKLTVKQLCEKTGYAPGTDAGVSAALLGHIERENHYPGERIRTALCNALGVTEADLWPEGAPAKPEKQPTKAEKALAAELKRKADAEAAAKTETVTETAGETPTTEDAAEGKADTTEDKPKKTVKFRNRKGTQAE